MIKSPAIMKGGKIYTDGSCHDEIRKNNNFQLYEGFYGFITDKGRFVDREQALKIARECGQVNDNKYRTQLLSSDILFHERSKL